MKNINVEAICSALEGTGKDGTNLASEIKRIIKNTSSPTFDSDQENCVERIARFAAEAGYLELFKLVEEFLYYDIRPALISILHPVIFEYILTFLVNKDFSDSKHLGNLKKFLLNHTLDNNELLKNFSKSIGQKDIVMMRFFNLEKNLKLNQGFEKLSQDKIELIFGGMHWHKKYDTLKYLFQNYETDSLNKILKEYLTIPEDNFNHVKVQVEQWSVLATLYLDHYRFSSLDASNEKFKDTLSEEQKMASLIESISRPSAGKNELSIHLALLTQDKPLSQLTSKEVLEQISRSPFLDQNAQRYALRWAAVNTGNYELDLKKINLDYHQYIAATATFSPMQRLNFSHQVYELREHNPNKIALYVEIYQKAMPYFKIHACTQIFIEYLTRHVLFAHGLIQLWSALSETPREKPEKCFCLASRYSWLKSKSHAEEKFLGHYLALKEPLTQDQQDGLRSSLTLEQVHDSRYRGRVLQAVRADIPFVKAITLSNDQISEQIYSKRMTFRYYSAQ